MEQATGRALACASCGETFRCGIGDSFQCWCARLPVLPASARLAGADCLCEKCLRAALAAQTKKKKGKEGERE